MVRKVRSCVGLAVAVGVQLGASVAFATVVPFTEDFAANAANWFDAPGTSQVNWVAVGGPDGGGYVSTTFNFVASGAIDTPALFRAQDELNSSGNAFVGNWVTDGVAAIHGFVRHNTGVPTSFFIRYASPVNFPGAATVVMPAVPSGQWTQFVILLPNDDIVFEGPFTYPQVFGNIGHVQIGVAVPPSLVGVNQVFTFDLDKVGLLNANGIPAVSTWSLVILGLLVSVGGVLIAMRRLPMAARLGGGTHGHRVAAAGIIVLTLLGLGNTSFATVIPFTEDFNAGPSNWFNRESTAPSYWVAAGGPDGGAYVTTTLNFEEFFSAGQAPALFRAHDDLNSSNNAFVGDWIVDQVTDSGYWVRHDASVPLQFFTRYATTLNHPAANSVTSFLVQPNVWTPISFPVPDPNYQFEGIFGFEDVFHAIGHIQTGLVVPGSLVGVNETFRFDMDKFFVVPEPATCGMLLAGGLIAWVRRPRP